MTKPTDRRLTRSRVTELREELAALEARLEARLDALEARPELTEVLAEELGQAALRTLRRRQPTRTKGPL